MRIHRGVCYIQSPKNNEEQCRVIHVLPNLVTEISYAVRLILNSIIGLGNEVVVTGIAVDRIGISIPGFAELFYVMQEDARSDPECTINDRYLPIFFVGELAPPRDDRGTNNGDPGIVLCRRIDAFESREFFFCDFLFYRAIFFLSNAGRTNNTT